MWRILLKFIPLEKLIPYVVAELTGYTKDLVFKLIDEAVNKVVEAERKYGRGRGSEKAQAVKKALKQAYDFVDDWIINLLVEIAVGIAKKKGLI